MDNNNLHEIELHFTHIFIRNCFKKFNSQIAKINQETPVQWENLYHVTLNVLG